MPTTFRYMGLGVAVWLIGTEFALRAANASLVLTRPAVDRGAVRRRKAAERQWLRERPSA